MTAQAVDPSRVKTLIVGGCGLIGGATALLLRKRGHEVTIAGRNPPARSAPLSAFPYLRLDYINDGTDKALLAGFDALVFAAGNDIRHKPAEAGDEHWHFANSIAIPRFFETARDAGIRRGINVGSFYPQAAPELMATNAYVRSRGESDAGVVALASGDFAAMSVNAPLVIGPVEGVFMPMFQAHTHFAQGRLKLPEFVPPGGVNFISTRSLAEAIAGALERGQGGQSYLVGDENLSFQDYFGAYFAFFGKPPPPVRNEEAPIFPDRSIYFGRGRSLFYEPDPASVVLLGYRRNDVIRSIAETAAHYAD